ncbi:MAG: LCP family protein [Lachnospiraceae bacterium]|nr:LCP family protein [Lachnospiraceae bacterium]
MKPGKFIGKVLLRTFKILGIISIVIVVSFLLLCMIGKAELYQSASTKTPVIRNPEAAGEEYDGYTIKYQGEEYVYNEDILTILVMGIDSLDKLPNPEEVEDYILGGQADTLFLVVINPHTKEIELIAINRNSMTEVDVYDSDNNFVRTDLLQVCLQHGYGSGLEDSCEREVQAVSRLFYDLPIHGYLAMNMAAVPILNDSVGGVRLEVMENVPWGSEVISSGEGNMVTLEGMDAYYYLQYRDVEVFDSASMRLARQKQYLNAFAQQAIAATKEDITFPVDVLDQLSDYTVTDMNASKVMYLATTYINYSFNTEGIYMLEGETITGGGGFEEFYVDDDALYALIIDIFYEKVN